MGLHAYIYTDKVIGNCSNGGISSQFNQVCIVNAEGPSTHGPNCPAVLIESHVRGIVRAVPAVPCGDKWVPLNRSNAIGPMAGGAFIHTSDSRFGELIEKLTGQRFYGAVALHDRYETQEQYDRLSR